MSRESGSWTAGTAVGVGVWVGVGVPLLCAALLIPEAQLRSQPFPQELTLTRANAVVIYRGDDGVIDVDSYTPIIPAADGSIIVLDRRGGGVFSLKHRRPLQRIGRQGSGPGEFREPIAAGWLNDTLWVSDKQTHRVTLIPRAGSGRPISRAYPFAVTASHAHTMPYGIAPEGPTIVAAPSMSETASTSELPIPIWRMNRQGTRVLDTLSHIRNSHRQLVVNVRASAAKYFVAQPFSDAGIWSVSSNGRYFVQVDRHEDGGPLGRAMPKVMLRHTDGRLVYERRLPNSVAVLTNAEFNAVAERLADRLNAEGKRLGFGQVDMRALLAAMYRPARWPAASDVIVSSSGVVAIRAPDQGVAAVSYTLLDTTGTTVGRFDVPITQRVRALSGSTIWSVREDANGELEIVQETLQSPARIPRVAPR